MSLTHGSLFSGIGGFDLAAEWAGWDNLFHCELNPFGRRVLHHYWPNATSYEDITKSDFTIWRGRIDVLTGGFPCQPYSMAGKRLGKEDGRHLWPAMLGAIRQVQPRWVVGENVLGIVNWNAGMVFDEVQADLEAEGYEVQPFVLPACAVNAPHRRDRVWFVAHSNCLGLEGRLHKDWTKRNISRSYASTFHSRKIQQWKQDFPTQPPICSGDDGLPTELDGIAFSKWRNESIKAYGNAIVPQVALQIFKAINEYESQCLKP